MSTGHELIRDQIVICGQYIHLSIQVISEYLYQTQKSSLPSIFLFADSTHMVLFHMRFQVLTVATVKL